MPHFGVHCFAITRNLFQIRYHDDSAFIKVPKKHCTKDLKQNFCVGDQSNAL